jgi:membrane associated rhomboid family serine protease
MAEQDQVPKDSAPTKAADSGGSDEVLPSWLDEDIPTPAIKVLIWINTAVFLAMVNSVLYSNAHIPPGSPTTRESILFFSSHTLFAWGANAAWRTILDKEYWRILTNTFIHASVFHLAINMYVLWSFSSMVERLFGRSRFLLIYFLSAIGSSVCSLLLLSADGISVGASGAIF